ncbi:MAG: putative lipid II flippase FtsW [Holosporales bacterium]|jgi:cell division protein FtsW|nr:putative lipid II flippase FtsW [Holosporales bacterium]
MTFARSDGSVLSQWWWTVDRWLLATFVLLLLCGAVFTMAATPAVAMRLELHRFYFVYYHLMYAAISGVVLVGTSLLSLRGTRRLSVVLFLSMLVLMMLVPFFGFNVKGAKRWIQFSSFSLQPSEFMKPSFAILTAWMLSEKHVISTFPGNRIAMGLCVVFVGLLMVQPDLGTACIVFCVWFAQLFVNGLPFLLVGVVGMIAACGLAGSYFLFPHVSNRIDRFFNSAVGDHYQIEKSLEAFSNGRVLGVGPGEGTIKRSLPDAHADFIFSVIGEEFGFVLCMFLVALYTFIVLRGLSIAFREKNSFVVLSLVGLLGEFGLQTFINMASTLYLVPTKGTTLPFISYGGSSMVATSIGMGMVLALTRHRALGEKEE